MHIIIIFTEHQRQKLMNQDIEHLNLLSIFHYIMGGLNLFASLLVLAHLGQTAFLGYAFNQAAKEIPATKIPNDFPIQSLGSIFIVSCIVLGLLFLILLVQGIFNIIAGSKLKTYTSISFLKVVAGINCIHIPLGTVLGVFTFVVLGRPSVVAMFEGRRYLEQPIQYR